jgi:hypothetical protein
MSNKVKLQGVWVEVEEGERNWLHFEGMKGDARVSSQSRDYVNIFGMDFHVTAIEVTGGDLQEAADPRDQRELDALHLAGGSDSGYEELWIHGHPYVVFLTPFDR